MADATGGTASGFVLLDKPEGVTSFRSLSPLKRLFGTKRVGHAGTLDQEASGLLVAAVGRATRLLPWIEGQSKHYRFRLHLGRETDTCEVGGSVIGGDSARIPTTEGLNAVLPTFCGKQEQVPPQYSAVKLEGRRASDIVRSGGSVELRSRSIEIYRLLIVDAQEPDCWNLDCVCSKGTYIRALARDIGRALGCGGCVSGIRRMAIGDIAVAMARNPMELGVQDLLPVRGVFPHWPVLDLDSTAAARVLNGNWIHMPDVPADSPHVLLRTPGSEEPTHLAEWDPLGRLQPRILLA